MQYVKQGIVSYRMLSYADVSRNVEWNNVTEAEKGVMTSFEIWIDGIGD